MAAAQYEIYNQARLSRDPRFDGKFFIAVKTTKIFCRTICPAKLPLERNVVYFNSIEEAIEAGFRPCLRCNPELSPKYADVCRQGTIARTIFDRIQAGELLTTSVAQIAEEFHTSPRNLNKIFTKYHKLPLKKILDINKALFAKKLIHCSDLSILDISEICGYSSVSGLYALMGRHFKIAKENLNKLSKTKKSGHLITLKIPYKHFYDWHYFIEFQSKRLISSTEKIYGKRYRKNIFIDGVHGFFEVEKIKNYFELNISKNFIHILPKIISRILTMLDVETNIQQVEFHLKNNYSSLKINPGLHIPGAFCAYEAGVRAICGQQVSISAATKLLNHFSETFGHTNKNGEFYFPRPSEVTKQGLKSIKATESKKDTLLAFCKWCASNNIETNVNDLLSIKGIGPWTVNYIKLRGLNESDVWMGSDLGIKKALKYFDGFNSEKAAPWRSYLSIQLWNNL